MNFEKLNFEINKSIANKAAEFSLSAIGKIKITDEADAIIPISEVRRLLKLSYEFGAMSLKPALFKTIVSNDRSAESIIKMLEDGHG